MITMRLPKKLGCTAVAIGGDLKCRPAVASGDEVAVFDEIGDLASPENQDALEAFLDSQAPGLLVSDLHPAYFSSNLAARIAAEKGIPVVRVQHHRAHVAAVCVEHGLFDEAVVGLAFDGTGYGDDGTVWGGEFFVGSLASGFERRAHFALLPLPGGDAAVREPWRIALALLIERGVERGLIRGWLERHGVPLSDLALFERWLKTGTAVGRSSALGRWFDAASALLGIRLVAEFEAQPAIELQKAAEQYEGSSPPRGWTYEIERSGGLMTIDFPKLDRIAGCKPDEVSMLAAAFHRAVADAVARVVGELSKKTGASTVVASGGCFLNALLDRLLTERFDNLGMRYVKPKRLPPGDQAIALGQIGLLLSQGTC